MRDVADKVAPHRLQPTDARQVLQHDQVAGRIRLGEGLGDGVHKDPPALYLYSGALLLRLLLAALPEVDQLVLAHDLGKGAAQSRIARCVQNLGCSRVDETNAAIAVGNDHPIGHALQDGRQAAFLICQGGHLFAELVGHVVERIGQMPHFVAGAHVEACVQISFGHALGDARQLSHRPHRALGDYDRRKRHQQDDDQRRQQQCPAQVLDLFVHLAQGQCQAYHAQGSVLCLDANGDIHGFIVVGGAVADVAAKALGQRLAYFGPVDRPDEALLRLAQDAALGVDDGHLCAQ